MHLTKGRIKVRVDTKRRNRCPQDILPKDDCEPARHPKKEHFHTERRDGNILRLQGQKPFMDGLDHHHNMLTCPSKLRTRSFCHNDSRYNTYAHDGVSFEPGLHIGTQPNREACPLEGDRELSNAWCHATIFFTQHHRQHLRSDAIADGVPLSCPCYRRKAKDHAMRFEHLKWVWHKFLQKSMMSLLRRSLGDL